MAILREVMPMFPWSLHSSGIGAGERWGERQLDSHGFYLILNAKNKVNLFNGLGKVGTTILG